MEVKINHVSFTYDSVPILQDIVMHFESKKITCIIGKSGTGKTTLLELIDGLLLPSEGQIEVGEQSVFREKDDKFNTLRKEIGYLFQNAYSELCCETVQEELEFAIAITNPDVNKKEKIKEILGLLQLNSELLDRNVVTLSHTEKKDVVFASLLVKEAPILLLDEPFLDLDNLTQKRWIQALRTLKNTYHKTIVIVTHDCEFPLKIADYLYILYDGKIRLEGDKYSVLKQENKLQRYGIKVPDLIKFSNMVLDQKGIKIGYRDEIKDLIKDVYRYVK